MKLSRTSKHYGAYFCLALLLYGVYGAFANDLYLPGRRTDGIHFHNEAVSPALVSLSAFALLFFLDELVNDRFTRAIRIFLISVSLAGLAYAMFLIVNPVGKRTVDSIACRETYQHMTMLIGELNPQIRAHEFLQREAERCEDGVMLETYHMCVMAAKSPQETNSCSEKSEHRYRQKNAT